MSKRQEISMEFERRTFEVCWLCEEPIPHENEAAPLMLKSGIVAIHKDCAYRLTMGLIDEVAWRNTRNIPYDAPYRSTRIAGPVMRNSLRLPELTDYTSEERVVKDYQYNGASKALVNLYANYGDDFVELVERAMQRGEHLDIMNKSF